MDSCGNSNICGRDVEKDGKIEHSPSVVRLLRLDDGIGHLVCDLVGEKCWRGRWEAEVEEEAGNATKKGGCRCGVYFPEKSLKVMLRGGLEGEGC